VTLLFIRVLQKLGRDTICVNTGSHEIVAPVAQHANDFSRQRFVQDLDHGLSVGLVAIGYRALLDVLARPLAERFDISQEWFISHKYDSFECELFFGEATILLARAKPEQVEPPDCALKNTIATET
jgi:hypothetical protein